MAIQIQVRRGIASLWTSTNPTLAEGELGYETDTKKAKIGDGSTAWTSLSYFPSAIAANQIAYTPSGGISSTDIAAAIAELDSEKITNAFTPSGGISATTISGAILELDAEKITNAFTPSGNIAATTLSGAIVELDGEKQAKVWTPTGNIASTTIEGALTELDNEKVATTQNPTGGQVGGSFQSGFTVQATHGNGAVQTHHAQSHDHSLAADGTVAASAITFSPTGSIAATTVQAAIAETASEAVQLTGSPTGGQITGSFSAGLTVADTHGASGVQTHHAQSHAHSGADGSGTVAHTALTGLDTDTATSALHHTLGTGANQAAAGNHTHTQTGLSMVYTTSDQSLASTTTLTTATPFNITVAANAILTIDYWLPYIAGAGSLKVGWSLPTGGATITWATTDLTAGSTTTAGTQVVVASSTAVQFVRIRAYYIGGSQSGTVSFQWAQNASSTTATVLKKGAWATYIVQ